MSFKELFHLCLKVLGDWKVICTVVAMLLIVAFAKFVTSYTQRPKRDKKKKAAPAPAPAPAAGDAAKEAPKSDISEKDAT